MDGVRRFARATRGVPHAEIRPSTSRWPSPSAIVMAGKPRRSARGPPSGTLPN